jgi:hypothetical protein
MLTLRPFFISSYSLFKVLWVKTASTQVVFVKHVFYYRIGWATIVSRILLVELNCHDDSCTNVGAAPLSRGGIEFHADLEIFFSHRC